MITTGVILVIVPLIIVALSFVLQGKKLSTDLKEDLIESAYEEMDATLDLIVNEIKSAKQLLEKDVKKVIELAELVLEKSDGIHFADTSDTVRWRAANQYTGRAEDVNLPAVVLGNGEQILPETSFDRSVPVVDEIFELSGDTATIFQRMNDAGDMLRVATNVDQGGARAVGTYIPAVNPDGSRNPVIRAVLSGDDFVGRAFVVNQWYVTVYRPLFDKNGEVSGILYVGTPESAATANMLDEMAEIKIGDTGYVFILNTRGNDAGRYVLSYQRERDGEVILGLKDSDGRPFIREMVEDAVTLEPGEHGVSRYPYRNPGDSVSRTKVSRYAYFADWDWLIGVGAYEDELYQQANRVDAMIGSMSVLIYAICGVSALVAALIFMGLTGSVVKPIEKIISSLQAGGNETTAAAHEVSSASQNLAQGASDQAASLEEAHASMETMQDLVHRTTEVTKTTRAEAADSNKNADIGVRSMHELLRDIQESSKAVKSMSEVIAQIKESSGSVSKIIGKIDDIAFQTNILALNASVEAARAGEAGAGFAVVAEEVSNLAGRAAEAAKETAALIDESVKRSEDGVTASDQVSRILGSVAESSDKANKLLEEIAASIRRIDESMTTIETNSDEQNAGIGQLTDLVSSMNNITQENAASAEETASASEELNAQAVSLKRVVEDLAGVVYGAKAKKTQDSPAAEKGEPSERPMQLT